MSVQTHQASAPFAPRFRVADSSTQDGPIDLAHDHAPGVRPVRLVVAARCPRRLPAAFNPRGGPTAATAASAASLAPRPSEAPVLPPVAGLPMCRALAAVETPRGRPKFGFEIGKRTTASLRDLNDCEEMAQHEQEEDICDGRQTTTNLGGVFYAGGKDDDGEIKIESVFSSQGSDVARHLVDASGDGDIFANAASIALCQRSSRMCSSSLKEAAGRVKLPAPPAGGA